MLNLLSDVGVIPSASLMWPHGHTLLQETTENKDKMMMKYNVKYEQNTLKNHTSSVLSSSMIPIKSSQLLNVST